MMLDWHQSTRLWIEPGTAVCKALTLPLCHRVNSSLCMCVYIHVKLLYLRHPQFHVSWSTYTKWPTYKNLQRRMNNLSTNIIKIITFRKEYLKKPEIKKCTHTIVIDIRFVHLLLLLPVYVY